MLQQKNKKIFLYFFLFLLIATLNNKNFRNISFTKDIYINVSGLDETSNIELKDDLNFLRINNLFFLDEIEIKKIINSNNLIEKFFIFKRYPSTLDIKIHKTTFLAQLKKNDNIFFLGSNGKLIKSNGIQQNIPFIFGDLKIENFFELKKEINESNFDYNKINDLFFFKSGRWDIKMDTGLLIKLPKKNIKGSLKIAMQIMNKSDKKIKMIDLRQFKQIIINE